MASYIPVPPIFSTHTAHGLGSEAHTVRAQADHVRALLDELDLLAPPSDRPASILPGDAGRAVESLAHLARRMMAAVASMTPPPPAIAGDALEEED